jgi:hypothetical protein
MNGDKDVMRIFCPKCGIGVVMKSQDLGDAKLLGYSEKWQGKCECGVYAVLAKKPLPAEPTFTIQFNIYAAPKIQ